MNGLPDRTYAVYLGLDVGKEHHHACALDPNGKQLHRTRGDSPGAIHLERRASIPNHVARPATVVARSLNRVAPA